MPRDLPIGNGGLLIGFDLSYEIRDIYYPNVGQENHTMGCPAAPASGWTGNLPGSRIASGSGGWNMGRIRSSPR